MLCHVHKPHFPISASDFWFETSGVSSVLNRAPFWATEGTRVPSLEPAVVVSANVEGEPGSLLHPVEQVSWIDCGRELGRLNIELPTEAQ